MKVLCAMAAVGLSLMASMGSASAQPYGVPDYEYREPYGGPGYRYRRRDYDDGYEYRERGPRYRGGAYGFDEREYLYCNPDVRRAVRRGQFPSGAAHYQLFGRREGRRLRC